MEGGGWPKRETADWKPEGFLPLVWSSPFKKLKWFTSSPCGDTQEGKPLPEASDIRCCSSLEFMGIHMQRTMKVFEFKNNNIFTYFCCTFFLSCKNLPVYIS